MSTESDAVERKRDPLVYSPLELEQLRQRAQNFLDVAAPSAGDEEECWHCGGEGWTYDCIDGCCEDAEEGCELCAQQCVECVRRVRDELRAERVAILRALDVDLAIGWLYGYSSRRESLTRADVLRELHIERTRCDAFTADERADSACWVEGLI